MQKPLSPFLMSLQKICFVLLGLGFGLLALMLFLPDAGTTIWQIRWYPLHLCSLILLSVGVCALLMGKEKNGTATVMFVGWCLGLMAAGFVGGALHGPFPSRALIYSFATLSALFCAAVLLTTMQTADFRRLFHSQGFQLSLSLFLILWCGWSLYGFISGEVLPLFKWARRLDTAAQGGLYDLLLEKKLPELRNAAPFGHPNYNSGFLLLILPLLLHGIRQPATRLLRTLSVIALALGLLMLLSTQSRNALLGMALAAAVTFWWTRSSLKHLLPVLGGGILFFLIIFVLVPRFQSHLFSVSPGRWGMWTAAWWTGLEYFPWGSGEGLTPEMLQKFSPALDAVWENSIQFHHTWLQVWAVSGGLASIGLLGITFWCGGKVLQPWKCDDPVKPLALPSAMALAATFVVFWADYQLDLFPMAMLLFFHITVLAVIFTVEKPKTAKVGYRSNWLLVVPVLALLISASRLPASLASRREIAEAGLAFEQGELEKSVTHYLRAFDAVAEPYALNMAAMVSVPQHRDEAIALFNWSLDLWEPQVLVHEYLVSLYIKEAEGQSDPDQRHNALQSALKHAGRRASMAPQLKGVYLDMAQIAHQLQMPEEVIVDALFYECLMQGDFLFPGAWAAVGDVSRYEPAVLEKLTGVDSVRQPAVQARIEQWQGFLHAAGRYPETATLSEAAENRFDQMINRSSALQLLEAALNAPPQDQPTAIRRLLVYLFENEVSDATVDIFLQPMQTHPEVARVTILCFGEAPLRVTRLQGVGLSARHPFSIPVPRPRSYPDAFGSRFLPDSQHKTFQPEMIE